MIQQQLWLKLLHKSLGCDCWDMSEKVDKSMDSFWRGVQRWEWRFDFSLGWLHKGKWNRNCNSIRLWPKTLTFVKPPRVGLCASPLAAVESWVVLIYRLHAAALSWKSGFDKPLLSIVWLRWQEATRSAARRRSSWTMATTLQGLASICFTQLCCFHVAEREWLCQFDL